MKKFVLILFFLLGISVLTLPVMAQTTQSTDQKAALLHQGGIEISTDGRLDFSEYKLIERDDTGQHINDLEPPAISFGTIIFVSISPEGIIMIMTSDGKVYEFYKPAPAVEEAEEVVIDNEPGSIRSISSTPIYSYRYSLGDDTEKTEKEKLEIEKKELENELEELQDIEAPQSEINAKINEIRAREHQIDQINIQEELGKSETELQTLIDNEAPPSAIVEKENEIRNLNSQLDPSERENSSSISSPQPTESEVAAGNYRNLIDERSEVQAEVDRLKTLVKSGNATEAEREQLKAAKETLTDIDHEIKTSPELTEQRLQYLQNDPAYINADDATKKRLEAAIESRDTATANREMDVLEKKQEHKQATAIREEVETELSSARDGLKGEIYDKGQAIEKETTKLEALKKEAKGLTGEALTKKEQEIKEKEEQIKSLKAEKEKLTEKRKKDFDLDSGELTNDEKTQIGSAEKALNQAKEDEAAAAQAVQSAENKSALWRNIEGTKNIKVTEMFSVGNEGKIKIVTEDPDDETNIFSRAIKLMIQTIGAFAVLMLIVGGFYMVTAQGDETRLTTGKNIFTYTALGLIVAFLSYAIVQFVISILFS